MDQTIRLDAKKRESSFCEERIYPLRRGERNNALLTVKVCANGQPYDLSGKTASLVATTAAGKLVGPCPMEVAEAGIARIMLPAALYSAVGSFSGYVEIREGETLVDTTDRFGGKVIECADLDSEQAAEFTPLLGELQNAVADEAKRVEAEKARAQAETERDEAEKKRCKAEEQRAQDSKTMLEELAQAKINAETATGEANTARDEAKKAATDATSAAGNATDAAGLAETAKTNANTAAEEANAAATKAEAAARKADGAAETAGTAASTAEGAANKADTAAGNAESMAEKADASANKADIAAGKANEATVAATNAATKANEVEAKLTGNILKGKAKDTFVHVDDAFPSSLLGIEIEGACRQDGTPSPDNPVPIEVIEYPILNVRGRNFWDKGIIVYDYSVDYLKYNAAASIKLEPGTYTVSSDGRLPYIQFFEPDSHKQITCAEATDGVGAGVKYSIFWNGYCISPPGDISRVFSITLTRQVEMTMCVAPDNHGTWIQIERGTEATAYAPYVGTSQAFTLPAEHPYLAKLPDGKAADTIEVDKDGNVELVARVGMNRDVRKIGDFHQGEYYSLITGLKQFASEYEKYSSRVLCSALPSREATSNYEGIYRTWNGVYVRDTSGRTKEEIQAEVDKNAPLTVAAKIPETRYHLGKIEMPKAQDSIINFWTDAEVTPNTGIEYTRDVNIVVANLESAIASITQS